MTNPLLILGGKVPYIAGMAVAMLSGAPTQTLLSTMQSMQSSNIYISGQTVDWYNNNTTGQLTDVFYGSDPNWTVANQTPASTGYCPVILNYQAQTSSGNGWYGPSYTIINNWIANNGIVTIAFSPNNPAGSTTDGGGDTTHNPNPTTGTFPSTTPTSSSVIYNAANIINGSAGSGTWNAYQYGSSQSLFNQIDTLCTNLLSKINGPYIFIPMGEANDYGSGNWWRCAGNGGTPYFTPAQWGTLYKLVVWRLQYNGIHCLTGIETGTEYSYTYQDTFGVAPTGSGLTLQTVIGAMLPAADSTFPSGYVDCIGGDFNGVSGSNSSDITICDNAYQASGIFEFGCFSFGYNFNNASASNNWTQCMQPWIGNWPKFFAYVFFCQKAALGPGTTNGGSVTTANGALQCLQGGSGITVYARSNMSSVLPAGYTLNQLNNGGVLGG